MKNNKYKIWDTIQKCLIAGAVVSGVVVGGATIDCRSTDFEIEDLNYEMVNLLKEETSQSREYVRYVKGYMDSMYHQYRSGVITAHTFTQRCEKTKSDEFIVEYAKNSDDAEAKAIVEDYESRIKKKEEECQKAMRVDALSMTGFSACAFGAYFVGKKKKEIENEIEM